VTVTSLPGAQSGPLLLTYQSSFIAHIEVTIFILTPKF